MEILMCKHEHHYYNASMLQLSSSTISLKTFSLRSQIIEMLLRLELSVKELQRQSNKHLSVNVLQPSNLQHSHICATEITLGL